MTQDQQHNENYEAPKVEEVGTVEDLTLGRAGQGRDNGGPGNPGNGPWDQGSR